MSADLLIGIDVGTTRVKAVVHTLDGVPLDSAAAATPWRHDRPGPSWTRWSWAGWSARWPARPQGLGLEGSPGSASPGWASPAC